MIAIIMGGASGVGKTTLCKIVEKRYPGKVVTVTAGEALRSHFNCSDAELNTIPAAKRKTVVHEHINRTYLLALKEAELFVLDIRFVIQHPDNSVEYPIGLNIRNKFHGIVVVDTHPKIIQQRRMNDANRDRASDIVAIQEQQKIIIERARFLAQSTGLPCKIIDGGESSFAYRGLLRFVRALNRNTAKD
jgi:adenylate kinase